MTDYSSEDFWKGAPEGSTHYLPADAKRSWAACWYKQDIHGQWLGLNASNHEQRCYDKWTVDNDQVEAFTAALIARPAPPWSGDGLPPVGTVCELSSQGAPWGIGTIQYTAENVVVWRWNNQAAGQACACYKHEVSIRPIKTPTQIAAEEREAAIDEMAGWAGVTGLPIDRERKILGRLYDGGYRKQENPE